MLSLLLCCVVLVKASKGASYRKGCSWSCAAVVCLGSAERGNVGRCRVENKRQDKEQKGGMRRAFLARYTDIQRAN